MTLGSWRRLERLAEGGGGEVWRVEHCSDGQRAVMKTTTPGAEHQVAALHREYLSLTAVSCAALPMALEWLAPGADGRAGLVMEERAGETLVTVPHDLNEPQLIALVDQALTALMAVHAAGLVHGDLHPGNWLLDAAGRLSLLDLGLAQAAGQAPAWGAGLPQFAAPGRLRGEGVHPSDDLFSLAMTLWSALGGGQPWPDYPGVLPTKPPTVPAAHTNGALLRGLVGWLHPSREERPETAEVARRIWRSQHGHGDAAGPRFEALIGRPWRYGVWHEAGREDGLPRPRSGQRWTLVGPAGSGRTGALNTIAANHEGPVVWLRPSMLGADEVLRQLDAELERLGLGESAADTAVSGGQSHGALLRAGAGAFGALSRHLNASLVRLGPEGLVVVDDVEALDERLAAALVELPVTVKAAVVLSAEAPQTSLSYGLPPVAAFEVATSLSQADGGRVWSPAVCDVIAEYVGARRGEIWQSAARLIDAGVTRQTLDEVDTDEPASRLLEVLFASESQRRVLPDAPATLELLAHLMLSGRCAPGRLGDPAPSVAEPPAWVQRLPGGALRVGPAEKKTLFDELPAEVVARAAEARVPWLRGFDTLASCHAASIAFRKTQGDCDLRDLKEIDAAVSGAVETARFRDAASLVEELLAASDGEPSESWLASGLRAFAALGRFEGHNIALEPLTRSSRVDTQLALAEYGFYAGDYGACEAATAVVIDAEEAAHAERLDAVVWRTFARVWQGQVTQALDEINETRSAYAPLAEPWLGQLDYLQGLCAYYQGRLAEAQATFVTLEEGASAVGVAAAAAAGAGLVHQRQGELAEARAAYARSRTLAQRAGDRARSLNMSMNIATLDHEQGELAKALTGYDVVLEAANRLGNTGAVTRCLINRGNALSLLGAPAAARADLAEAVERLERSGDLYLSGHVCTQLAELDRKEGLMLSARRWVSSAIDRLGQADTKSELQEALLERGWQLLAQGDGGEAQAVAERGAEAAMELKSPKLSAQAAHLLGRIHLWRWLRAPNQGDVELLESAARALDRASESLPPGKRLTGLAIDTDRATVFALLGRRAEARRLAEAQLRILERLTAGMSPARRAAMAVSDVSRVRGMLLRVLASETVGQSGQPLPTNALSAVVSLNQRLSAEHDTERLLAVLMDSAIALTGAERGFLLLDTAEDRAPGELPNPEELQVSVARNLDRENLSKPSHKLSHSIALEVFERGEPVLSIDAQADPRFQAQHSVHAGNLRSIMSVPMNLRGRTMGVLYVDNRFTAGAFSREQAAVLEALAAQAAIALHTARLIQRYRRSEDALAASKAEVEALNVQLKERLDSTTDALSDARQALAAARLNAAQRSDYASIKGQSDKLARLFSLMDRVRDHPFSVLIVGESGTGKELVARAIHYTGARAKGPFVAINCGALPENLLESELFGHVKGAFTGAVATRRGLFEQADGGTLFLDEIGEMPPSMQVKLLRVLQTGEFSPVGGTQTYHVDVRILGATHRNLEQLVKSGAFREDLLYRLRVVELQVPPLRERREDISVLVDHFLEQNRDTGIGDVSRVTARALRALQQHPWPGNVRELEMFLKSACVFADGDTLDLADVAPLLDRGALHGNAKTADIDGTLADVERRIIEQRLERFAGNKSQTAQSLGIDRGTLYNKIRSWKA